jgi:hypothetical protein
MKLRKSAMGRFFIILYYTAFGAVVLFLTVFLMLKINILIGLAAGFVMGMATGALGGKLDYTEHTNVLYKKYLKSKQQDSPESIIPFPPCNPSAPSVSKK